MSKDDLVVVTQNQNKLRELAPLFKEYDVEFETTSLEKFEIRSDDVREVALVAAKHSFELLNRPSIVDDTGLYIEALQGFPRAYPAFVLDTIGRRGILKLMSGISNRNAEFITAVGFCDGVVHEVFTGVMRGSISLEERGDEGFGYDSIFIPEGFDRTYAELSLEEKVAISHRTRAFRAFLHWYSRKTDNK